MRRSKHLLTPGGFRAFGTQVINNNTTLVHLIQPDRNNKSVTAEYLEQTTIESLSLYQRKVLCSTLLSNLQKLIDEGVIKKCGECLVMNREQLDKFKGNGFKFHGTLPIPKEDCSIKNSSDPEDYENFTVELPVRYKIYEGFQSSLIVGSSHDGIQFFHLLAAIATAGEFSFSALGSCKSSAMSLPLPPKKSTSILSKYIGSGCDDFDQSMKCNQHQAGCCCPKHITLERRGLNMSRQGCPGPEDGCNHADRCCAAGSYFCRYRDVIGTHIVDDLMEWFREFVEEVKARRAADTQDAAVPVDESKIAIPKTLKTKILKHVRATRPLKNNDENHKNRHDENAADAAGAEKEISIFCLFGNVKSKEIEKEWSKLTHEDKGNTTKIRDPANYKFVNDDVESQDNGFVENMLYGCEMKDLNGSTIRRLTAEERLHLVQVFDEAHLYIYGTSQSAQKKDQLAATRSVYQPMFGYSTIMEMLEPAFSLYGNDSKKNDEFRETFGRKLHCLFYGKVGIIRMHRLPFQILFDRYDNIFERSFGYMQVSHQNHYDQDFRLENLMLECNVLNSSRSYCAGNNSEKSCWHLPRCKAPGLRAFLGPCIGNVFINMLHDLLHSKEPANRVKAARYQAAEANADVAWAFYQRQGVSGFERLHPDEYLELPGDWRDSDAWKKIDPTGEKTKYFREFLNIITTDKVYQYNSSSINFRSMFKKIIEDTTSHLGVGRYLRCGQLIAKMYFVLLPLVLDVKNCDEQTREAWKRSFLRHLHFLRPTAFGLMPKWFKSICDEIDKTNFLQSNRALLHRWSVLPLPPHLNNDKIIQSYNFNVGDSARGRYYYYTMIRFVFEEREYVERYPFAVNNLAKTKNPKLPDQLEHLPMVLKGTGRWKDVAYAADEYLEFITWKLLGFTVRPPPNNFTTQKTKTAIKAEEGDERPGRWLVKLNNDTDRNRTRTVAAVKELRFDKEKDTSLYWKKSGGDFKMSPSVHASFQKIRGEIEKIINDENESLGELLEAVNAKEYRIPEDGDLYGYEDIEKKKRQLFSEEVRLVRMMASMTNEEAEKFKKTIEWSGALPWCVPKHYRWVNPADDDYKLPPDSILTCKNNNNNPVLDLDKINKEKIVCQFDQDFHMSCYNDWLNILNIKEVKADFKLATESSDVNVKKDLPAKESGKARRGREYTSNEDDDEGENNNNNNNNKVAASKRKAAAPATPANTARTASTKKKTANKINEDDDDEDDIPFSMLMKNNNNNNNNNNMMPVQQDTAAASAGPITKRTQKKQQQTLINQTPSTDAAAPNNNNTTAAAANRGRGSSSNKKPGTKLEFNK